MTNRLRTLPVILLIGAFLPHSRADESSTNPSRQRTPAMPAAAPASTTTDATSNPGERPTTYTVVNGDTLWDLSHKFNCSVSSFKKLNKLKKNNLKPGQVLKSSPARSTTAKPVAKPTASSIPSGKPAKIDDVTTISATPVAPAAKVAAHTKTHHHAKTLVAQPVQDFDVPTSTFASCPAPPSNGSDIPAADEIAPLHNENPAEAQASAETNPVADQNHHTASATPVANPEPATKPIPLKTPETKKSFASALSDFFGGSRSNASESGEWGNRFLVETRNLASQGIGYDQSWRPDGESHSWAMDCSNTTRYLYQVTAGIQLPRTASDQYYYLHLQNKAWDVPTVANGFADCNFLRHNLKPGDLLFWENTYRPERQPPITHVMIFLGTNARGQWIMAGSQSSRGGEHNRHHGGPDVYVFDPDPARAAATRRGWVSSITRAVSAPTAGRSRPT